MKTKEHHPTLSAICAIFICKIFYFERELHILLSLSLCAVHSLVIWILNKISVLFFHRLFRFRFRYFDALLNWLLSLFIFGSHRANSIWFGIKEIFGILSLFFLLFHFDIFSIAPFSLFELHFSFLHSSTLSLLFWPNVLCFCEEKSGRKKIRLARNGYVIASRTDQPTKKRWIELNACFLYFAIHASVFLQICASVEYTVCDSIFESAFVFWRFCTLK